MIPKLQDIAYEFCHEPWDRITLGKRKVYSRIYVFFSLLKKISFLTYFGSDSRDQLFSDLVFFVGSKNQEQACLPIIQSLDQCQVLTKALELPYSPVNYKAVKKKSVKYIPIMLYYLITSKGYENRAIRAFYTRMLFGYGFYSYFLDLLSNSLTPKLLVIANDHSIENRALILAAKHRGVKTLYLQHASVSEEFPKLDFDFAFLDGKHALEKYLSKGLSKTKVFLTGISKLDKVLNIQKRDDKVLGVCLNRIDNKSLFQELLELIEVELPDFKLVMRPHPASIHELDYYRYNESMWEISLPSEETALNFLKRTKLIISDVSNISLEAVMLNSLPIYFATNKEYYDYYGFAKNGLIGTVFTNPSNIVEFIKSQELDKEMKATYQKSAYYNSSIGTEYEGRSTELISNSIKEILDNGTPNGSNWSNIESMDDVYLPV